MASIIGTVSPFNEAEDTWQSYAERLEFFFVANEIESEAKKQAIFLSSMGVKPYKLLSNLVSPRKPGDCTYREILDILENHHNPRPSTIVQRFKFNSRVRAPSESVRVYVAELKRLSEFCEYNDSLEEMLRDRLVCGINDSRIQQRLLSERQLTFAKTLEIAQAMEAAAEGIQDLAISSPEKICAVQYQHAAKSTSPSAPNKSCYRCGGPHAHNSCKFKDSKCYKCQKIGHIAKLCRSNEMTKTQFKSRPQMHKAHMIEKDSVEEQSYGLLRRGFKKSRAVGGMRDALSIEEELGRLQRDGIVEPVEHSEWATPIVPVRKKDGTVRICGDYKTTVNQVCSGDNHPIPRIEDLAYALSGGDKFTKLDLSHAYTQLQLAEDSRKYTTINTHKGLFTYHRLCFGISAAPGIFQRTMEGVFRHVPGCVNYLDDVYVTGKDDEDHLKNLHKVLSICEEKGLSLRRDKCEFMQPEVTFLGYRLDKHGIYPLEDKVKAIRDAPRPGNAQELRSFLGLVNFYGKFISNVSQILSPLYQLLRHGQRWRWDKAHESAFTRVKSALSSEDVLVHFKPEKEIVLICDASPYGVGAILTQLDSNGYERPVAYASRALNDAERKYSQIDREGLALIFAVKRFHKYIAGRYFKLVTDHKPLLGLFGEGKSIPEHASARVQRWAITLSAHCYTLLHRPGRENCADALSRLPLPYSPDKDDEMCGIDCVPEEVKTATHGIVRRHQDQIRTSVNHYTERLVPDPPVPDFAETPVDTCSDGRSQFIFSADFAEIPVDTCCDRLLQFIISADFAETPAVMDGRSLYCQLILPRHLQ
ncbi:hypothetical protein EGW08_008656 [Elysia chlorotica]|uniref:CCHC-type domain-containing protein n=1 Tax=Elysia chlorotica TaxID=188477 RepID=A0A3S0ZV35_ELYCH|nr:hypothetical protein EGW08_008656 [Elysia chlorotica]